MNTPRDRDEQLERWLHDGWRPQSEQTALCLDAEAAAAWADGVLVGAALEQAHVHAATCARCQALLATLVRTADAAQSTVVAEAEPRRRRWFTWVVPLTAAATAAVALAVWVRTPQPAEPSSAREVSSTAVQAPERPSPQVDARGLSAVPAPSAAIDAAGQTSSRTLRVEPDASDKSKNAKAQSSDVPRADASNDPREVRSRRREEAQRGAMATLKNLDLRLEELTMVRSHAEMARIEFIGAEDVGSSTSRGKKKAKKSGAKKAAATTEAAPAAEAAPEAPKA